MHRAAEAFKGLAVAATTAGNSVASLAASQPAAEDAYPYHTMPWVDDHEEPEPIRANEAVCPDCFLTYNKNLPTCPDH